MTTPEGRVKDKVRRFLASLPKQYRFMPVQNGMGAPGLDFYCCINGAFVAIETKVEGKKLTDRQKETARQIADAGGTVYVIRNDRDIAQMATTIHGLLKAGTIYDNNP